MQKMPELPDCDLLSLHAQERIEERKLDPVAIEIIQTHSDIRRSGQNGCTKLRISRRIAKQLDVERKYARKHIENARELLIVVNPNSKCVTAYKQPVDTRFRCSGARPSNLRRHHHVWRQANEQ